jgi:hypothetical protein
MSRSPQEKFVLLFETAKRSLLAAEMLLHQMSTDLAALEGDIDRSIDVEERAISPLLSAVAFIDFAHRFGSVVDALPLINKGSQEVRRLRKTLKPVENARNHLQHMRGDLSSNAKIDYPLLGALSWANGSVGYTIFLSQPTNANAFTLAYNFDSGCWEAQHQYTVKDAIIDLDGVLREMHIAYDWIVSVLEFSDPTFAELKWGKTQSLGIRIQMPAGQAHEGVQADGSASRGSTA